jgi:transposase-like protein
MPKKRRKLDVFCQNPKCLHFNKKGLKNIVRNGKKKNGTQNYKCTSCNVAFVRTKGTPLYHSKLSKKEVKNICNHFTEKNSFRGVARVTNHSLNAIYRVANKVGKHCKNINNELIINLALDTVESDEVFSFIKKRRKTVSAKDSKTMKSARITAT